MFVMLQRIENQLRRGENVDKYMIKDFENTIHTKPPDIRGQNSLLGKARRFPRIIITGMQKCGTGALKDAMTRSPYLAWSSQGESHFFDRANNYNQGYQAYLDMQPEVGPEVIVFDKTPSLMTDSTIPARVNAYDPDVKIISILCEPTHRTLSHYLHAKAMMTKQEMEDQNRHFNQARKSLYNSDNFEEVIESAIDEIFAQDEFVRNAVLDMKNEFRAHQATRAAFYRYVANPANFEQMQKLPVQLIQRGLYGYYLNQWYDLFPKENILILSSADMSRKPAQTMATVQEFLGVPKAVDPRNFFWNNETGHYCVMGPEDDEPHCGNAKNKNRSSNFEINPRTKIILNRIYQSVYQDLVDLVGNQLFSEWGYN